MPVTVDGYAIDCIGDICVGDDIRFTEYVFAAGRRPRVLGERVIYGTIVRDNYGAAKQQHTFTIVVSQCEGYQADKIETGSRIQRKGRKIFYSRPVLRRFWADEVLLPGTTTVLSVVSEKRAAVLDEKHKRGAAARLARERRAFRQQGVVLIDSKDIGVALSF